MFQYYWLDVMFSLSGYSMISRHFHHLAVTLISYLHLFTLRAGYQYRRRENEFDVNDLSLRRTEY